MTIVFIALFVPTKFTSADSGVKQVSGTTVTNWQPAN